MKCHQIQAILSAYHDDELMTDRKIAVEVHLESCSECASTLASIRHLSQTAARLPEPTPSRQLWNEVEETLNSRTGQQSSGRKSKRRFSVSQIAVAALLLLASGIGIFFVLQNDTNRDYLTDYWQTFESDPEKAQEQLLVRYSGKVVSEHEAMQQVGYRPLTSAQAPKNVAVEKTYLLNIPSCKCLQTICRRADGTVLAVFEYKEKQPDWFRFRPHVQIQSEGTSCYVTELEDHFAVFWRIGQRSVMIVGLRNVEELSLWVRSLAPQSTAKSGEVFFKEKP